MITNKTMSEYIVRLFHRYNTTKEVVSKLELQEVLYRYVGRLLYDYYGYSVYHEEGSDGTAELAGILINLANSLIELSEKEVNEEE